MQVMSENASNVRKIKQPFVLFPYVGKTKYYVIVEYIFC